MVVLPAQEYNMIRSKECFKCNAVKPLEEFYKHPMMADGHVNKCKECNKNDVTANRNKNIEKVREYDRARGKIPERIKAQLEITRAWRAEDSRRNVAHSAVARAVRNGLLVRMPCVRCGKEKRFDYESFHNRRAISKHHSIDLEASF
jgi:formate dehydrogenase maturation protein FdhE